MHKKEILKYGLIITKGKQFLINRKKKTSLFLLPGGKPKGNETPQECLIREIKEEHNCGVDLTTLYYLGEFRDQAANEQNTDVIIRTYVGEIVGEPTPSSEIVEQRWFGKNDDRAILSPIIQNNILPVLIEKQII